MDTPQPTPSSPNAPPSTPDLDAAHEALKKFEINPDTLIVCQMSAQELIFGEIYSLDPFLSPDDPYLPKKERVYSVFETSEFVAVKNPKRLVRHAQQTPQGIAFTLIWADYDLIDEGVIEVRPQAVFFLSWLDAGSQLRYCNGYLNWLEGRVRARAEASGIKLAAPGDAAAHISKLMGRIKG